MRRWAACLWALPSILLCVKPVCAQVQRRLEGCSPYSQATGAMPQPPRIIVDDVRFDPSIPLLPELKTQLSQVVKAATERAVPGWLDEVLEVGVSGTMEDEGYFRQRATAEFTTGLTDSEAQHVFITLHVEPGPIYRIGEISFRSADPQKPVVFPQEELRKLFPISEGDLFSAEKIRHGLDALKKYYGTLGYIDFVPEPVTDVDDAAQRVSITIMLDQQKQFRIGKITVLSLDPTVQPLIESHFKTGDIFNSQAIEDFFEENKSAFPPDASLEDVEPHRDVKAGIVDLRFNLLTCEQFRSTLDP